MWQIKSESDTDRVWVEHNDDGVPTGSYRYEFVDRPERVIQPTVTVTTPRRTESRPEPVEPADDSREEPVDQLERVPVVARSRHHLVALISAAVTLGVSAGVFELGRVLR